MELANIKPVIPEIIGLTRTPTKGKYRREGSEIVDADTWADMCRDAEAYRVPHAIRGGKTAEYTLRKDAVIGYAAIFKLPAGTCWDWADHEHEYFLRMSLLALRAVDRRIGDANIFRESNVRKWSYRRGHSTMTVIGDARDEHGNYCGGQVIDFRQRAIVANRYPDEACRLFSAPAGQREREREFSKLFLCV